MPNNILIVSGEPSGDLHASNLVRDLISLNRSLRFYGIGGELSRNVGVDIVFDITKLALVGVVEVIKNLSVVKKAHDAVIARIEAERPELAILVDYPGFNLKLASDLSRHGIPVAYYISPQIWAWGFQRIHIIKRYVNKMLVLFKFEEELYRAQGIDAEFVGHPLVDVVKQTSSKEEVFRRYGLSAGKRTIALLPGSRESEIRLLFPALASAAGIITKEIEGLQFIISKHAGLPRSLYEDGLKGASFDYRFVEGDMHNVVAASDFAIVASGTATLETAMLGIPMAIVYKVSLITYILYKTVATTRFLGIVNIIADREVSPELLQFDMTPEKIAGKTIGIISDPAKLDSMRRDLEAVKASLGPPGASRRAASTVLKLLAK